MSVWDSIVGQQAVVGQMQAIVSGDPKALAQSWLICGPPGSGRSNVARAFAAALESPDRGLSDEPTNITRQVLSGTHPDVTTLATNKVTIGIDDVRQLILTSEQMPSTAPWRIIIIEDVDRMLERTTNVLLKEIEEPSPHTIWLLCAPSAQDVLPTIRSRTRIVNLAVPSTKAVADYLMASVNPALPAERQFDRHVAVRAARLAEGHIGIAKLYASDTQVMSDRDELIVGLLGLRKASDAVLLADDLIDTAKSQAEADVNRQAAVAEADFRRINGLGEQDRIPPKLRGAYNAIAKKDEITRQATRRSRDVLDRALNSAASIYREQAGRLGKQYPMSAADNALMFRSGNPRPAGDADAILKQGKKFYEELSPETGVFVIKMLDDQLMDVPSTPGKAGGGYCTSLGDYEMPFIFANFNGTQHDVEVVTHEAGHAFAAYMNRDRIPYSYVWPSMEACEVHSMSMEFFAWPWADGFFGADARKFRYSHLAGALTFIPYGTMVDHFQHIVYEHPELTPAQRHEEWKKLAAIYQPWMRLDGEIPFYGAGEYWQRQMHIYQSPFYYIDYCLAQTVSLQFWAMLQKDRADAWSHYMAYTKQGGSRTFTELLKNAGLSTPFEESCLRGVSEAAKAWLDSYDLTGIV